MAGQHRRTHLALTPPPSGRLPNPFPMGDTPPLHRASRHRSPRTHPPRDYSLPSSPTADLRQHRPPHGNVLLRYLIPLACFLIAAAVLLIISPRTGQRTQALFLQLITPFFKTGSNVQEGITQITRDIRTLEQLEEEVQNLRLQNRELQAINQLLRDLEAENNTLRASLEFQQRSVYQLLSARVIRENPSAWWHTIQIDRGERDGLIPEMPVLTEKGLVGKISTVAPNTATVLLLLDESCQVAALVDNTTEQGILGGSRTGDALSPTLLLRFLAKSADIRPGQAVVSSGAGGVFPPGIPLGTIRTFRIRELNAEAEVDPAVDFSKLDSVFIVIGRR